MGQQIKLVNPRAQAFQMLKKVISEGQSLTQVISQQADTTPFAKAMCFGVLREYTQLSIILNHLLDKKPKKIGVTLILLLGIYQLKSADKADYASVTETVSLTRLFSLSWASGFVNGVLRRFAREKESVLGLCEKDADYTANHPHWLRQAITDAWPSQSTTILAQNDKQAPMTLRVNLAKTTLLSYQKQLEKAGFDASPVDEIPSALILAEPVDVYQLPGFSEGLVSVQDSAAQMAAYLLDLQPGVSVLDACCAPGGKTCHILELQQNLSRCVAVDISQQRLERVQQNLDRLDLNATLMCGNATEPSSWWDGQLFDRILLDAPCSALGVVRRHPDIKYHRKPEDIPAIVATQAGLLSQLWSMLKPGGLLLYATCSILPVENEEQMRVFLEINEDATLEPLSIVIPSASSLGLQLFPKSLGHDGFYYALLRKQ